MGCVGFARACGAWSCIGFARAVQEFYRVLVAVSRGFRNARHGFSGVRHVASTDQPQILACCGVREVLSASLPKTLGKISDFHF